MSVPLNPMVSWYLFCLGLGVGLALLVMTGYLSLSPPWLRWLLLISGMLAASRYVVMALFAVSPDPQELWGLRACWFGTSIGLTLPGMVALDQLVRHPAMTPKKLLKWYAPFLAAYLVAILFGPYELTADPLAGQSPRLVGWGRGLLAATHSVFVAGFVWLAAMVCRKLPVPRIRLALGLLMAAYAYLGVDGVLRSAGGWYVRPYLYSEFLAMGALWFALDTARRQALA